MFFSHVYLLRSSQMSGQKLLTTQKGQSAWLRHHNERDRIWRIIDAKDQVLGRVAGQIAKLLQGKHKPTYLDNMNCGDPVIVINARHVVLTGRKRYNKAYYHHSGYPGGLKKVPIRLVQEKRPEDVIRLAVKNMLPSNKLRAHWLRDLRIFMDEEHEHVPQKPVPVAPAHCGSRIGEGGPPTMEELEKWWNDTLIYEDEQTVRALVDEVRQELQGASKSSKTGLAVALALEDESQASTAELEAQRVYVAAAEESLRKDPIVVPSLGA